MTSAFTRLRSQHTSLQAACIAALTTLVTPVAFATNGTMPHGYGIKAMGMGGVSIALPQDAVAAANNPAGMAFIGERVDLGLSVVLPRPEATLGGTNFDGSGVDAIAVPDFGYNRPLDKHQTVGVSVYGNGVATKYSTSIAGGPGSDNDAAQLTQIIIAPTYAIQLAPGQALGVSLDLAYQRFKVDGVPDSLGRESRGTDTSTGVGFKIGWTGQVTEQLTLGAVYVARIQMGKLSTYSRLLANDGEFDIPERYGIGAAWRPVPSVVLAADVMRVNWGKISSLANGITASEPGFGWQNQTITRIGAAWDYSSALTLRAGVSYGTRIINKSSTFLNYLAPVTPQSHLSMGGTYKLDVDNEISFMTAHAYGKTVRGTGASSGMDVRMTQNWFGASWSRSW